MAFLILEEDTGESIDTSQQSFQHDNGKVTRRWRARAEKNGGSITTVDLLDTIKGIVGYTNYASVGGGLNRFPPAADSQYPFYYASHCSVAGYGTYSKTISAAQLETGVQTITQMGNGQTEYTLWDNYVITVEATPRPYPVMGDSTVAAYGGFWYDDSGAGTDFVYWPEWMRFCDWDFIPVDDYVTQQRGGAYFKTGSLALPNKAPFQGQPRMLLPNQIYRLLWVGVPLRYLTSGNSYLRKWRGRINQNVWLGPQNYPFQPGELLYVGYKPQKFQPPIQALIANGVLVGVDYSKLVNIELTFLYTTRTGTDLPAAPANGNYIMGGHNLLPYFPNRNYYYTVFSPDGGTTEYPMYLSFPLELMFTDPDA